MNAQKGGRGPALFRFDAGREMGGGHAMRCLGLAAALAEQGIDFRFATRRQAFETLPAIQARANRMIPVANDTEIEAADVKKAGADWLVVDHPAWDVTRYHSARSAGTRILAISDTPVALDCDIVVDTTADRSAAEYANLVPRGCAVLGGPAYAFLRPEFATLRKRSLAVKQEKRRHLRALVGFGATDPRGATLLALRALAEARPDASVDVVLGAAAPCLDDVRRIVAERASSITLHIDTNCVAELMAQADFAVGAAGITSWERCCLGLPAITIAQAGNQHPNAAALRRHGAAYILPDHAHVTGEELAAAVARISGCHDERHDMGRRAAALCDGLGARRVAQRMYPERASDGSPVCLRPATEADSATIFGWQTEPETRRYFRNPAAPSLCEHEAWYAARLSDPDTILSVVEHNGRAAGVLRLDSTGDGGWEVSILISQAFWRLGIGLAALRLGRRLLPFDTLHAEVHGDNIASRRLFAEAGYRFDGTGYVLDGAPQARTEA